MNAKGSGQGSVYFNKSKKRWVAVIRNVDPVTQKIIRIEKLFKTESEANEHIKTINYQKGNEHFIENNGIPLIEIMKSNIQLKLDTNQIGEAQYNRVLRSIKKLNECKVVHKNVDTITSDEIQAYINTLKDYSDSTIKKLYQQFSLAFKTAVNKGYIIRNPMTGVIRPKSTKADKDIRAMTIEEETKFINYLIKQDIKDCPYRNEFLIQLFMGLRIGECLALTLNDIDLNNRKIFVHRTLTNDIKGTIIMSNSPKTKAGVRYLPIPDGVYLYIVEQMNIAKNKENNPEKLLFKPPTMPYADRENANRSLSRILKKLGIEHMSSHSLRHTYATRVIEAGVTPVVLQKLMGHTDVSITLNTYTSVFDKYKETELEKVNQYYMQENLLNPPMQNNLLNGDKSII